MASPIITILPVTLEHDFPALLNIEDGAYQGSKLLNLLFKSTSKEEYLAVYESRLARHIQTWKTDPSCRYNKAVTETGEIVGMAVWHHYTDESVL